MVLYSLFPNPATDNIRVDYSGLSRWLSGWERTSNVQLNVIDNIGRVVYSQSVPEYSAFQNVDVSKLSKGLYFVAACG